MMRITMLGTGNALVTECYNTCFVLSDDGGNLLVDTGGGNGILHQLRQAGFSLQNIHDVFITHSHIDHILGVIWLIRISAQLMNRNSFSGDINIYSHDEVIALVRELVNRLLLPYQAAYLETRIHLHAIHDGDTLSLIGQEFKFFDICSERTKQFGFRMTHGDMTLTFCGDEPCKPMCERYVQDSEWLIHESFCLYSESERFKPYEKHHSTVKDSSELAQKLGVKNLILTHTEDSDLAHRKQRYTQEGRQYFSGNVYVPDDLESLTLL